MNVNIMKSNGEVVHWSTYQDLLPEELKTTEQQTSREAFDAKVAIKCGPGATVEDFSELVDVETPEYDLYEDRQNIWSQQQMLHHITTLTRKFYYLEGNSSLKGS